MNQLLTNALSGTAVFATKAELADLQRDGLVEIGPQEKPGSNRFQYRLTESGKRAASAPAEGGGETLPGGTPQGATEQPAGGAAPAPAGGNAAPAKVGEAQGFAIYSGVAMPKRGRTGPQSKYPFEKLEVGQSFFVPATAEKAEPWKTLQSTVSTAQRRFAVEEGTRTNRNGETVPNLKPTRVFRLVKGEADGKAGAFITRTA